MSIFINTTQELTDHLQDFLPLRWNGCSKQKLKAALKPKANEETLVISTSKNLIPKNVVVPAVAELLDLLEAERDFQVWDLGTQIEIKKLPLRSAV